MRGGGHVLLMTQLDTADALQYALQLERGLSTPGVLVCTVCM